MAFSCRGRSSRPTKEPPLNATNPLFYLFCFLADSLYHTTSFHVSIISSLRKESLCIMIFPRSMSLSSRLSRFTLHKIVLPSLSFFASGYVNIPFLFFYFLWLSERTRIILSSSNSGGFSRCTWIVSLLGATAIVRALYYYCFYYSYCTIYLNMIPILISYQDVSINFICCLKTLPESKHQKVNKQTGYPSTR